MEFSRENEKLEKISSSWSEKGFAILFVLGYAQLNLNCLSKFQLKRNIFAEVNSQNFTELNSYVTVDLEVSTKVHWFLPKHESAGTDYRSLITWIMLIHIWPGSRATKLKLRWRFTFMCTYRPTISDMLVYLLPSLNDKIEMFKRAFQYGEINFLRSRKNREKRPFKSINWLIRTSLTNNFYFICSQHLR